MSQWYSTQEKENARRGISSLKRSDKSYASHTYRNNCTRSLRPFRTMPQLEASASAMYPLNTSHKQHNVPPRVNMKQPHPNKPQKVSSNHGSRLKYQKSKQTLNMSSANHKHGLINKGPPQIRTGYIPHMNKDMASKLEKGDVIDHKQFFGRFVKAIVTEKQGSNLKIHYKGWSFGFDVWSDFSKELYRFARAGSISQRKAHMRCLKGDYILINPSKQHSGISGWRNGKVVSLDSNSGQVLVAYNVKNQKWLYWTHLDDWNTIAPFQMKTNKQDFECE